MTATLTPALSQGAREKCAMRWFGYECLYLPSPLLTKEGNRKDKKQRKGKDTGFLP